MGSTGKKIWQPAAASGKPPHKNTLQLGGTLSQSLTTRTRAAREKTYRLFKLKKASTRWAEELIRG